MTTKGRVTNANGASAINGTSMMFSTTIRIRNRTIPFMPIVQCVLSPTCLHASRFATRRLHGVVAKRLHSCSVLHSHPCRHFDCLCRLLQLLLDFVQINERAPNFLCQPRVLLEKVPTLVS